MMLSGYLNSLLTSVYCLSPLELAVFGTYVALVFCMVLRKCGHRRWVRPCFVFGLVLWAAGVLWITILSREDNGASQPSWILFHSYREVFAENRPEILRSSMMNVALFFPAGLLWVGLCSRRCSVRRQMLSLLPAFFLFSLGIELSQYFLRLGMAEIDDVMHNTLGAVLGFIAFRLADETFRMGSQ